MKRIFGIIGSPRKMGNCELLVKEIAAKLPDGPAELKMVRLVEKDIRPCRACYRCLTEDCPIKDDFSRVMDAILTADGVIVSAPAYHHAPHSSLQRFLDRGLQFKRHLDVLSRKSAVAVAIAGSKDAEGYALLGVENFIRSMGMILKESVLVHAALPGEVLLSADALASATLLAASLFATAGPRRPAGPCCVGCGGTFFEFRGGNRIYCLSCGASGTVTTDAAETRIDTRQPANPWRGVQEAKARGEWLKEMKARYLRDKECLKTASASREGGEFI